MAHKKGAEEYRRLADKCSEGDGIVVEGLAVDRVLVDALALFVGCPLRAKPHELEIDDGARFEMLLDVIVAAREHHVEQRDEP
jgi:hypothetical protein